MIKTIKSKYLKMHYLPSICDRLTRVLLLPAYVFRRGRFPGKLLIAPMYCARNCGLIARVNAIFDNPETKETAPRRR